MAQVYSFTDENGVTRLFAEIHPDPAGTPFDGGIITQPLTVSTAIPALSSVDALVAQASAAPAALFRVLLDDLGGGGVAVEAIASAAGGGFARIGGGDDQLDGSFSLGSDIGFRIFSRSTLTNGATIVNVADKNGNAVWNALADGSGYLAAGIVPRAVSPNGVVTSGALSTVQLVTATGAQILTTRDAETITPCTFNPGVATTATVTVALSPDNVTYSTLGVETEPVGTVLDGTIHLVKVRVPAGWYLKLTVNAQATLGLTTYY